MPTSSHYPHNHITYECCADQVQRIRLICVGDLTSQPGIACLRCPRPLRQACCAGCSHPPWLLRRISQAWHGDAATHPPSDFSAPVTELSMRGRVSSPDVPFGTCSVRQPHKVGAGAHIFPLWLRQLLICIAVAITGARSAASQLSSTVWSCACQHIHDP